MTERAIPQHILRMKRINQRRPVSNIGVKESLHRKKSSCAAHFHACGKIGDIEVCASPDGLFNARQYVL
jgi:hypothetical protein